jgi:hypothetical protein
MIPGRLRADLADELGRRECEVKAWIEGHAPAPLAVAAWIEALAKAHETLAPPCRAAAASKPRSNEIEPAEIRLPETGYRTIQHGAAQKMISRPAHLLGTGFSGAAGIPAASERRLKTWIAPALRSLSRFLSEWASRKDREYDGSIRPASGLAGRRHRGRGRSGNGAHGPRRIRTAQRHTGA